jgi:hypothetical protein
MCRHVAVTVMSNQCELLVYVVSTTGSTVGFFTQEVELQ